MTGPRRRLPLPAAFGVTLGREGDHSLLAKFLSSQPRLRGTKSSGATDIGWALTHCDQQRVRPGV